MLAEVTRLELAMKELLALLADSSNEGVDTAWGECQAAEAELNVLLADCSHLSDEEREELRLGLEGLVRLNAIARQAALHGQEGLAASLAKSKKDGAKLRAYTAASSPTGDSCDLAG